MTTQELIDRCLMKWHEYADDDPLIDGERLKPLFEAHAAQNTALFMELARKVLPSYVACQWYFDELHERLNSNLGPLVGGIGGESMSNLNDLPLVAKALQNMCPVKIEPKVAKPAPSALWDYHNGPVSREDAEAWRERELGDMQSKFDREDSVL